MSIIDIMSASKHFAAAIIRAAASRLRVGERLADVL